MQKGGPKATREEARTAGEIAKAKIEEFKPTGMKTQEAARVMLEQQIFNEMQKNPAERDKAEVNFRRGSLVEIIDGAFKGVQGKVTSIDRSDKTAVKAWVEVPVLGHPVPCEIEFWMCKVVSY